MVTYVSREESGAKAETARENSTCILNGQTRSSVWQSHIQQGSPRKINDDYYQRLSNQVVFKQDLPKWNYLVKSS